MDRLEIDPAGFEAIVCTLIIRPGGHHRESGSRRTAIIAHTHASNQTLRHQRHHATQIINLPMP
jgi:hypothetical protein